MVEVNYDLIEQLLQARNISRRQLAKLIGVSPDTLAGSFRRKSKMKLFQLWQISKALNVRMYDLLAVNSDENYSQEELEKFESEQKNFEYFENEDEIDAIVQSLEKLNSKGLSIIKSIATLLSDITELKASYTVIHGPTITGEWKPSLEEFKALMNNSSTEKKEECPWPEEEHQTDQDP